MFTQLALSLKITIWFAKPIFRPMFLNRVTSHLSAVRICLELISAMTGVTLLAFGDVEPEL